MLPGEYEFGTAEREVMEILAGDLDVLLPGATAWRTVKAGSPSRSRRTRSSS